MVSLASKASTRATRTPGTAEPARAGSAASRVASNTARAVRAGSSPAARSIARGPARSGWTARSEESPRLARLEIALLARRRIRVGFVVVAGKDAHVVLGREAEDEVRLHAVAGVRAARVRGVGGRTLGGVRSLGGAELRGSARVRERAAPLHRLEDGLARRNARLLLAAETRMGRIVVRALVRDALARGHVDRRGEETGPGIGVVGLLVHTRPVAGGIDEVRREQRASLVRVPDQHGHAGARSLRIARAAEERAEIGAAGAPVPADLADLSGRHVDEAVRDHLEDRLQLAHDLLRLAGDERDLRPGAPRLRVSVDPVRVQNEPDHWLAGGIHLRCELQRGA